ncbi:MAG: hypothetical protein QM760_20310 [Nibricoccus sp.]
MKQVLKLFPFALVFAAIIYWWVSFERSTEYCVAFLERNFPDQDEARSRRSALFEEAHRIALADIIRDYNRSQSRYRLRLHLVDPPPKNMTFPEYERYLEKRYSELEKIKNLVCVFDNCWGDEINKIKGRIESFPAPIVFLNADHNESDFGGGRIFVGSSDSVPGEIDALLPQIIDAKHIAEDDVVFATEEEYKVGDKFKRYFRESLPNVYIIELPDNHIKRAAQMQQKADIIRRLLRREKWAEMQGRPKLLILNVHAKWGNLLIPWLDETFDNLTVICHQSALSRDPGFRFGRGNNELILLSASDQTIPESLYLRHRELLSKNPEEFNRGDSVFYLRRCVIAMDACSDALVNVGPSVHGQLLAVQLKDRLRRHFQRFVAKGVKGSLGEYRFNQMGEFLGQNHFLSYREKKESTPYGYQLIYNNESESSPHMVPNVHVGVRNIEINDIDISRGKFHVKLDYWLRQVEGHDANDDQGNPKTLLPVAFDPDELVDTQVGKFGQRLLVKKAGRIVSQRTFHLSGEFDSRLESFWYPFDRHALKVDLQAWDPDSFMRLSRQPLSGKSVNADGWIVGDSFIALNNRENNPEPLSGERLEGGSSQYDVISLTVNVKRVSWNALLLLAAPLSLLAFASIAILYIKFSDDPGGSAEFETLKTQTELSIAAVLAVITYLISYATIVPRVQTLLYADFLVMLTLIIAVFNFIFVVAVRARKGRLDWWTLERYRRIAFAFTVIGFLSWFPVGVIKGRYFLFST